MVHDDCRGALLGNELVRGREFHAQRGLCRQQLEQLPVVLEIRTRAIAPRVALAPAARNAQLALDAPVHPLGHCFGRLDGKSVGVEGFAVLSFGLERLEPARGFVPNGHDLERHDIDVRAGDAAEVVRDAQSLAAVLPRKMEPCLLHQRAIPCIRRRLVDDDVVAEAPRRKVPVHRLWLHPATVACFLLEARECGLELLLHDRVELRARAAAAPLQSEQLVLVQQVEYLVQRNVVKHLRAPERCDRHRVIVRDVAALATRCPAANVLAHVAVQERVVAGVRQQLVRKGAATRVSALQLIHRLQPLECILAIEHA